MRTGDNDNAANAVCRQMGYSSGEIYTFGSTSYLPTMPIVAGWRICHGGESDLFACEDKSPNYDIDDQDCINGCLGPDGRQGTLDDTIDSTCTHAVDQGAICHDDSSPSRVALERCSGGCACTDTSDQPVAFGCVDCKCSGFVSCLASISEAPAQTSPRSAHTISRTRISTAASRVLGSGAAATPSRCARSRSVQASCRSP